MSIIIVKLRIHCFLTFVGPFKPSYGECIDNFSLHHLHLRECLNDKPLFKVILFFFFVCLLLVRAYLIKLIIQSYNIQSFRYFAVLGLQIFDSLASLQAASPKVSHRQHFSKRPNWNALIFSCPGSGHFIFKVVLSYCDHKLSTNESHGTSKSTKVLE